MAERPPKPVRWVGSSKADLSAFPADVKSRVGGALWEAQLGGKAPYAKPLRGFAGAGVLEVVDDFDGDTYRAVYTVRFASVVYVLHAFQKKSPQRDQDGTGRCRPGRATVEDRATGLRGPLWQGEALRR